MEFEGHGLIVDLNLAMSLLLEKDLSRVEGVVAYQSMVTET